jgi:hypothetical protein
VRLTWFILYGVQTDSGFNLPKLGSTCAANIRIIKAAYNTFLNFFVWMELGLLVYYFFFSAGFDNLAVKKNCYLGQRRELGVLDML